MTHGCGHAGQLYPRQRRYSFFWRRLVRDYEARIDVSEAMILVALEHVPEKLIDFSVLLDIGYIQCLIFQTSDISEVLLMRTCSSLLIWSVFDPIERKTP